MDLVQQTLQGMASRNADEGVKAMGRHARTIRLGRSLWESPPLESNVARLIQERFFDDGIFPPMKDVKKERLAPSPGANSAIGMSDDHRLRQPPGIMVAKGETRRGGADRGTTRHP